VLVLVVSHQSTVPVATSNTYKSSCEFKDWHSWSVNSAADFNSKMLSAPAYILNGVVRRRRAVSAISICISSFIDDFARSRGENFERQAFCFDSFVESAPPRLFRRLYRMDRHTFDSLCEMLTVQDAVPFKSNAQLPLAMRLSVTLRWLAGGSYLDISLSHHIAISSFYHAVDKMIYELNRVLVIRFPYDDIDYLEKVSTGFRRQGRSPLSGCVGALDGLAIKILEPARGSVANPSTYFNRKGFFSLSLQAMCDDRYVFTFASTLCPGSTHDSTAFAMSSLSRLLSVTSGGLPAGYWIAADEAYVCSDRVMTPWPGRRLSVSQDAFNYWLSSARIHVEQAFGILVARWGILWRPLRVPIDKSGQIILACVKLHNFVLEKADSSRNHLYSNASTVPDPSNVDTSGHGEAADTRVHLRDEVDLDEPLHKRRRDLEVSSHREMFTNIIRDSGLVRPISF
jgi:DDE superfamily endonuclease